MGGESRNKRDWSGSYCSIFHGDRTGAEGFDLIQPARTIANVEFRSVSEQKQRAAGGESLFGDAPPIRPDLFP